MNIRLFLFLLVAGFTPAMAQMTLVTGSFAGSPTNGTTTVPFSGSFSYVYDASLLSVSGLDSIVNVAPDSLSLTPSTIGAITFNATNTWLSLRFTNRVLYQVGLGDRTGVTSVFEANLGVDDFWVVLNNGLGPGNSTQKEIAYTSTTLPGLFLFDDPVTGSFSTSAIPEPSTYALLMGLAAAGLMVFRSRHRAARSCVSEAAGG
jgi:PEP-CTERM motif